MIITIAWLFLAGSGASHCQAAQTSAATNQQISDCCYKCAANGNPEALACVAAQKAGQAAAFTAPTGKSGSGVIAK